MGDVSITVNGNQFLGWKEVTIQRSLQSLCGTFSLSYTDAWDYTNPKPLNFVSSQRNLTGKKWYLQSGDFCQVAIDGQVVLTGFIDEIESSIEATTRSFNVSGRDLTGDLVDCAASTTDFETWRNLTLPQIANVICKKFGISVVVEAPIGEKFRSISSTGESAHEIIDRCARQRGVLVITTEQGKLLLAMPAKASAGGSLIEGKNILSASLKADQKNRFSTYYVYGQAHGDGLVYGDAARKIKQTATDEVITRYRPKVIINDDSSSNIEAQKRAQWEATHNAAKGTQVTVQSLGWRIGPTKSDALWKINTLVDVKLPSIGIEGTLLIEGVTLRLNASGEIAELQLTRSDAWQPNPVVKKEKSLDLELPKLPSTKSQAPSTLLERAKGLVP